MERLTEDEANKILAELIKLRRKSKRDPSALPAYKRCEQICSQKFDYLVTSKLYKYRTFANYEDLKQDGRMALVHAFRNFDPKKGSFFWWANRYIETKIKREANRHSTIKIPIKQTKEYQPYKVSQLPVLVDANPDALQTIESAELKEKVQQAISQLPADQRKILELNGIKSYSISQIARELKIARPDCTKLLNEAKKNLRQNLETLSL
jgi:RNA polymerase sigma factor (sigma-70 family)